MLACELQKIFAFPSRENALVAVCAVKAICINHARIAVGVKDSMRWNMKFRRRASMDLPIDRLAGRKGKLTGVEG